MKAERAVASAKNVLESVTKKYERFLFKIGASKEPMITDAEDSVTKTAVKIPQNKLLLKIPLGYKRKYDAIK